MGLFKNIKEVKKYWPVLGSTEFGNIEPFLNNAERDYLIPAISQAQYDDLENNYQTRATLVAKDKKLLERCQAVLADYLFYLWMPTGQLQIGDNGIRIAVTETLKTAFEWQVDNAQRSVLKAAGRSMDALLAFMENNKTDYALWAGSESYSEFKETFITSASEFTKFFAPLGNSRMSFMAVKNSMMKVQEFSFMPLLGEDYYTELMDGHKDGNLSAKNALVVTKLKKALAPLTMTKAFGELVISIDERGILNFDSTGQNISGKKTAVDEHISKLEISCKTDGETYMQGIKDFLKANIGDYETYAGSDAYVKEEAMVAKINNPAKKTFTM